MAFHKDFDYVITGSIVDYRKSTRASVMSLPRNQGIDLSFKGSYGRVEVFVDALDINLPFRWREIGGQLDPNEPQEGPGSVIEEYNHIPVSVELFAPGQTLPVATWRTQGGWSEQDAFRFAHTIGAQTSPIGSWRCRVTNQGRVAARTNVAVVHFFDREPLRNAPLPLSLIDHAYQIILEALMPRGFIRDRKFYIDFGSELKEYFGDAAPSALGLRGETMPAGIQGTGTLQEFTLEAGSGRQLLEAMRDRWQALKTEYEAKLAQARALGQSGAAMAVLMQQNLVKNDHWRSGWEQRVRDDFAAIHAQGAISNFHLEREVDLILGEIEVNVADIEDGLVDVYLAFDPALTRAFALVLTPKITTGSIVQLLQSLGIVPGTQVILEMLAGRIEAAGQFIARYLGEALARLAARDAVLLRLTENQQTWRVEYTALPSEQPWTGPINPGSGTSGEIKDTPGSGDPPSRPPLGVLPPEFIVVTPRGAPSRLPEYTERLDEIEHFVVVMMENRSFDHMLGYLGLPTNSRYEGVRGRHTNPLAGRSTPARLRPAREVIPNPVTRIPYSPEHGQSHVKDQIADGAMSGFAQDFENSHPGFGEYVMTYYTGEDLKCYDQLARQHGVCDHWFSAFPGGTWPNRWTTLSGRTPELKNLAVDDSRIGFLEGETIFETLTRYNIDWLLFESDLSLIRTYNRYRLDTQHVLPFDNRRDQSRGFEAMAASEGGLPAVTFVEPNFRDIPPLSTANDDLAPADLLRGQAFIQRVVDALRKNPTNWSKTLLVITYDEHGGFYDHVPPPGTTGGPDAWEGRVPRLHSEGPDFMGVRVPALIVSPFVTPGSVCKQVFDHTSIIKTILLRHRRRFESSVFTKFGPRVNIAADLGLALSLDRTPQTETFAALPRIATTRRPAKAEPPDPGTQIIRRNDFHESLRRGFLPTRK